MKLHRSVLFFGCMILVLVQGCKEKDKLAPDIEIDAPSAGTIYQVYDTVQVSYRIVDDIRVAIATAEVVNAQFIPVTPKIVLDDAEGTVEIQLTDKLLETGDYYVLVSASDGENEKREYRNIRIIAVPKVRRAIYAATSASTGQDMLWRIDSLFAQAQLWMLPGQDVLQLCVNSLYDKLAVVGRYSPDMRSYSIPMGALDWTDAVFSTPQIQRYLSLTCSPSRFYVSLYDRELRAYGLNGALTLNRPTGEYRPETVFADGTYLLVEQAMVGTQVHVLNVYFEATNGLLWQTDFQTDIVAIVPLLQDEVLVFGNRNGQAHVFHYDIGDNSWWEPRQLPDGAVHCATQVSPSKVAFTHDDGVYLYTYSPNYLSLIKAGSSYRQIVHDADRDVLIVASGAMLEELTQTGMQLNALALSDSIVSFDIHYTR